MAAEVRLADPAHALRRQLERERVPLDDDVVVSERLPLLESQGHRERRKAIEPPPRSSAAVSPGAERRAIDRSRCPASLRIQVSWRLTYGQVAALEQRPRLGRGRSRPPRCAADLLEARSPCAPCATAPRSSAVSTSESDLALDHAPGALADALRRAPRAPSRSRRARPGAAGRSDQSCSDVAIAAAPPSAPARAPARSACGRSGGSAVGALRRAAARGGAPRRLRPARARSPRAGPVPAAASGRAP